MVGFRFAQAILGGVVAALTLSCTTAPEGPPAGEAPAALPPSAGAPGAAPAVVARERSRWVRADWSELPGWNDDQPSQFMPALRASCARAGPAWVALCARAAQAPADEDALRMWLATELEPWRIEAADGREKRETGLLTGYFEPQVAASRVRRKGYEVALYAPPPGLDPDKPYWTRRQLDTEPQAKVALRGREIAWIADPLDALLLQIQGSGRLDVTEPDGRLRSVRLAYAGHNGQPYKSVGRWLIEQGQLKADAVSWPAIRDWARRHPRRVQEMLWANPRMVFFKEEPLPDPTQGPRGAQGVPLLPGRSIAVDPGSVPYGTPVWLDSTEPLSATPLRRLVMAQDTGSAIQGAVRADFFWGWGDDAEAQAGRTKQPLRAWALWPRGLLPQGGAASSPGTPTPERAPIAAVAASP